MKLLFLAEKMDVNDDVLAFVHLWVLELSKYCEKITVICLQKGELSLPDNVEVLSLGKEEGASRAAYLFRLYSYIWKYRKQYDVVHVHQIVEYVLLGGFVWKLLGKSISMWYAHGCVSWRLRFAEKLVSIIFTSTKSGCRLESSKINVLHQGIDTHVFVPDKNKKNVDTFDIITVGRISQVKGYEILIKAVLKLKNKGINVRASILGGIGLPEQKKYLDELQLLVKEEGLEDRVNFLGSIPNRDIIPYLQASDLFVNMSGTGSLDKAILEAMACGVPILSCNESLLEVLGDFKDFLMYPKGDIVILAEKIEVLMDMDEERREEIGNKLRDVVVNNHNINTLIKTVYNFLTRLL